MNYKLSIITVNFNNTAGLQATIASVINQTFTNYEFLIIDGNSTDNSCDIITNYKNHISAFISEPDTGIFNAMNKGIKKAQGEYLLFLNSGDCLTSKTALKDFIGHERFHGHIIYGDYQFNQGRKVFPDHISPYYFMKTSLPHQSTLFHKSVFELMGGYDESYKMVSDRAFYLKCFLSNQFIFTHIPYALTLFDLNGFSSDMAFKSKKNEEDERMFQELYGVYYKDMKSIKQLHQHLAECRRNTLTGIAKRIKKRLGLK
jgi:glycosyltransferase involved in cell wall biosynthesis